MGYIPGSYFTCLGMPESKRVSSRFVLSACELTSLRKLRRLFAYLARWQKTHKQTAYLLPTATTSVAEPTNRCFSPSTLKIALKPRVTSIHPSDCSKGL